MRTALDPVVLPTATARLEVVLVNATGGAKGGVTTDVENIAQGLLDRGDTVVVTTSTRSVARALRAHRGLILHVFGCLPTPSEWFAMAAARAGGRVLVWTPIFHPGRRASWAERSSDWRMALPFRAMRTFDRVMPRAARFADAVIAATEAEATYFREVGARRVELIPPGVATIRERGSVHDFVRLRETFGLGDGPVILIVGRDSRPKGLDFGLAAFQRLRALVPDAQLLLVGPPADHPAGRAEGVTCPGWAEPAGMDLAYANSTLLFVPSLYEGLPRAVMEAWSFGLPVVASDRIALAPKVEGHTGRTVPYGDVEAAARAMLEVISEPVRAGRWGEKGRRFVREGYLLERVVAETIDLYEELARGRRV